MIGLIIVGSIHSILLDELIMGRAQRRIGPFNLGGYGFRFICISGSLVVIVIRIIFLCLVKLSKLGSLG